MKSILIVVGLLASLLFADVASAQFSKAVSNPPGLFNRSVAKTRGGFGAASVGVQPAAVFAPRFVGVPQVAVANAGFVGVPQVAVANAGFVGAQPLALAGHGFVGSSVRFNSFGSITQQDQFGNVFQVNAFGQPVFVGNRFGSAVAIQSFSSGFVPTFIGPASVGCGQFR